MFFKFFFMLHASSGLLNFKSNWWGVKECMYLGLDVAEIFYEGIELEVFFDSNCLHLFVNARVTSKKGERSTYRKGIITTKKKWLNHWLKTLFLSPKWDSIGPNSLSIIKIFHFYSVSVFLDEPIENEVIFNKNRTKLITFLVFEYCVHTVNYSLYFHLQRI